jgi:hypothetical protein
MPAKMRVFIDFLAETRDVAGMSEPQKRPRQQVL